MAATSERSKSVPKRSGCPSTRASRSAKTSSGSRRCSDIVNLLEQLPEPRTGSFHSHLQGRNAVTSDLGHLFVAQLFHVLHQERLTLVDIELLECVLNVVQRVCAVGRRGGRCV